jgi:hypothetical protein
VSSIDLLEKKCERLTIIELTNLSHSFMGKSMWCYGKKNLRMSSFMAQDKHTKEKKGRKRRKFRTYPTPKS